MSAGFFGLSDFVGTTAGQPEGGLTPGPAVPGFLGLLDFVGYPVGEGVGHHHGSSQGISYRSLFYLLKARRRYAPPVSLLDIADHYQATREKEQAIEHKRQVKVACYAVLAAEL